MAMSDPSTALRAAGDRYWEAWLEYRPTDATLHGDHRYDDRIEDVSIDAEARQRATWLELRAAVDLLKLLDELQEQESDCVVEARLGAGVTGGHPGVAAGERPVLLVAEGARAGDRVVGTDGGVLRPGGARQRQRGLKVHVPTRGPDGEVHWPDLCR
jgi:hypothetical protein